MSYLEVKITVGAETAEILVAELSSIGFDSFMEEVNCLLAYIDETVFEEEALKEVLLKYISSPVYEIGQLEDKNWNEEWEKNFESISVEDKVLIRASFHKADKAYVHEVVIDPKMSFGTGHHETTYMMVQHQLELNHKGKKVIDAGSGTGILAILASKLGAESIFAYDIEDWAFENLKENCILNGCNNIIAAQGTIQTLEIPFPVCDIILANINKNVLLVEIPFYSRFLPAGGTLLLSGFYEEDILDILNVCENNQLELTQKKLRNKWASLALNKK